MSFNWEVFGAGLAGAAGAGFGGGAPVQQPQERPPAGVMASPLLVPILLGALVVGGLIVLSKKS